MHFFSCPSLSSLLPPLKAAEGAVVPLGEGGGPFTKLLVAGMAPLLMPEHHPASSLRAEEEGGERPPTVAGDDPEAAMMAMDAEGAELVRPPADPGRSRFWGLGRDLADTRACIPIRADGAVTQTQPDTNLVEDEAARSLGERSFRETAVGVPGAGVEQRALSGEASQAAPGAYNSAAAELEGPHGATVTGPSLRAGIEISVRPVTDSGDFWARPALRPIPAALPLEAGSAALLEVSRRAAARATDVGAEVNGRESGRPLGPEVPYALYAQGSDAHPRSLWTLPHPSYASLGAAGSPARRSPEGAALPQALHAMTVSRSAAQPPAAPPQPSFASGLLTAARPASTEIPPKAEIRLAPQPFRDGDSAAQLLPLAHTDAIQREESHAQFIGGRHSGGTLAHLRPITGDQAASTEGSAPRRGAERLVRGSAAATMPVKDLAAPGEMTGKGPPSAPSVWPDHADFDPCPPLGAARARESGSMPPRGDLAAAVARALVPAASSVAAADLSGEGGDAEASPVRATAFSQLPSMPRQPKWADQGLAPLALPERVTTTAGPPGATGKAPRLAESAFSEFSEPPWVPPSKDQIALALGAARLAAGFMAARFAADSDGAADLERFAKPTAPASQIWAETPLQAPRASESSVAQGGPDVLPIRDDKTAEQRPEVAFAPLRASGLLQTFVQPFPAAASIASQGGVDLPPQEVRLEPPPTQVALPRDALPAPRALVPLPSEPAARADAPLLVSRMGGPPALAEGEPAISFSSREVGERPASLPPDRGELAIMTRAEAAPTAPMGGSPSMVPMPSTAPLGEGRSVAGMPSELQPPPSQGEASPSLAALQAEGTVRPTAPLDGGRATPPPLQQIAVALREGDGRAVEIRLQPEELGTVRITLRQDGEVLRVHLQAERSETLDLMRRSTAELALELQLSGHAQTRFSFDPSGRNDRAERDAMEPELERRLDPLPPTFVPRRGEGGRLDLRL